MTVTGAALPPTTESGVKPVIFGATRKLTVLAVVPIAFLRVTGPVTAPVGTNAFRDVAVPPGCGTTKPPSR